MNSRKQILLIGIALCQFSAFAQPSSRSSTRASSSGESWLNETTSVLTPVPGDGQYIFGGGFSHTMATGKGSAKSGNIEYTTDYKVTSSGADIGLRYGITNSIYLDVKVSYLPGKSDVEIGAMGQKFKTSSSDKGLREPDIAIGKSFLPNRNWRLIPELGVQVPIGNATTETTGNDTTSSGLSGGGDITPRLQSIINMGGIKQLTSVGYTYELARTSNVNDDNNKYITTSKGGNTLNLNTGLEFPNTYNLGVLATYSRSEGTNTFSSRSNSNSYSESNSMIGAVVYMGIPMTETAIISPRLVYMTALEKNRSGASVSQNDAWMLGAQAIVAF